MSELISELKKEHKEISRIFQDLQQPGITPEKAKALLMKSKALLLSHLKKEDKLLYPPLHKEAETDASLKITLNTFATNMEKITGIVMNLYQKYSTGEIDDSEYRKDIVKFAVILKGRIMKEEVAIFKAYDNLNK